MGRVTDFITAEWQEEHGIEPATGEYLKLLNQLSEYAYDLIKTIELEKSGIRDGDGAWHGSDVIGGLREAGNDLLGRLDYTRSGSMKCHKCSEFFDGGGTITPWPWPQGPEVFMCDQCAKTLEIPPYGPDGQLGGHPF